MFQRLANLSIKYKLLMLLVALPVLSLGTYSFVAIDLFKNDKVAYVYDSSAAIASGLSNQVRAELNGLFKIIRPMVKGYDGSLRQFSPATQQFFEKQNDIKYLSVFYFSADNQPLPTEALRQADFVPEGNWVTGGTAKQIVEQARQSKLILRPLGQGMFIFAAHNKSDAEQQESVVFAVVEAKGFGQGFRQASIYTNFLVDRDGTVIVGSQSEENDSDLVNWDFFSEIVNQAASEKTLQTKSPEGKEYVVSYIRVGDSPLHVVSAVEQSAALVAAGVLLWKSVIFFVVIVSLSFLISIFSSSQLTSALRRLSQASRQVADGNYNVDIQVGARDEVGNLAESFNTMASEVSRLMKENVEKARMEKELETAKAVQEMLFPKAHGIVGNVEVAGFYKSASECGGDWWHYCDLGDRVFLWIGDATGHGAPAALITSAAKSVASIVEQMPEITPAKAMSMLNRSIYENSKSKICMTFFIGAIHKQTGVMTYCNASHEPPIRIPHTEDGTLKRGDLEPIMSESGPRLGESIDSQYVDEQLELAAGDAVYFYTDGVTELNAADGSMFEERRLLKTLVSVFNARPGLAGAVTSLDQALNEFRQGFALKDDVTYFFAQFRGAEEDSSEQKQAA